MLTQDSDASGEDFRYVLLFSIRHSQMSPSQISKKLGITPTYSWNAGDQRVTPAGTKLSGVYPSSLWSVAERVSGNRSFFDSLNNIIGKIEKCSDFFLHVSDTGGKVSLIVQLAGDVNLGDELSYESMSRLARLRISLGVEVFPHMRKASE